MLGLVDVGTLPLESFDRVLAPDRAGAVRAAERLGRAELAGRRIWNVNSTARGGGVAEMLRPLLAYAHGAGVDARGAVIEGNPAFFVITKRLHNRLHGMPGDGGPLGPSERALYESALVAPAGDLCARVGPDDIVLLHDPQTAGLIPRLRAGGVRVIWRCHVGLDVPSDLAREAWAFLEPYVLQADAYVFSREAFVWEGLDPAKRAIIAPSIDVFAPKNAALDDETVNAILTASGLRADGTPNRSMRRATMLETRPLTAADRYVLQVSRWDSLKDPIGVIVGFAEHI